MTIAPTIDAATAACTRWDAIVIGAGPAGALAARQLAQVGLRVLLVERRAFPRFKVCGSCLNPRALQLLAQVGLGPTIDALGGVPLDAFQVQTHARAVGLPLPGGLALSRELLDATLARAAIAAGAEFLPETSAVLESVTDPASESRSVQITSVGQNPQLAITRVAVAADGLGHPSLVRGGEFHATVAPRGRVGIGTILPRTPWPCRLGTIHMAIGRAGYVGRVRIENGAIAIAAALDPPFLRDSASPGAAVVSLLQAAGCRDTDELLAANWQGTAPLGRHTRPLAGRRVFVLGDAAGYVEPFTGEGMTWALSAAVEVTPLVCRAVAGWDPSLVATWQRVLRNRVWRGQRVCRALAWGVRKPWMVSGAMVALGKLPALARPVLRRLNHHPTGLVKDLP